MDLPMLHEIASLINDVIDFEGTSLAARFIVKRGIDEEVFLFSLLIYQVG
jgi:hypothetical protein